MRCRETGAQARLGSGLRTEPPGAVSFHPVAEVWCPGVGRACRLLAQRASPPFGARGQSTKNLHPDGQAVEVFHLAMQQGQADADIAHVLTMDEPRRIASNIAKLPKLLGKGS